MSKQDFTGPKSIDTIDRIVAILRKAGHATPQHLARELEMCPRTANRYLAYMHKKLRTIRKARLHNAKVGTPTIWTLGCQEAGEDEELERSIEVVQLRGAAEQIGMWRDGLTCALFGAPSTGSQT